MASFWFWLLTIILSLVLGAVFLFILWGGFCLIKDRLFIKRGIPSKRERVSEYIKDNPEKFNKTYPGKVSEQSKQEVIEDDRKRAAKYREFEKLRREEFKGRATGKGQPNSNTPGSEQLPKSELLQNGLSPSDKLDTLRDIPTKRRVKLDD